MKKEKKYLSDTNNIADNTNNFIRMCYKLCNMFKLEISSMKGFNSDDRSFNVEFVGSSTLVRINFDYEEQVLKYEISSEENEKEIERYIIDGIVQVNYKVGEVVYDVWGNEYTVLEDTDITLSNDRMRRSYKIYLENKTGEKLKMSDTMISKI